MRFRIEQASQFSRTIKQPLPGATVSHIAARDMRGNASAWFKGTRYENARENEAIITEDWELYWREGDLIYRTALEPVWVYDVADLAALVDLSRELDESLIVTAVSDDDETLPALKIYDYYVE